MTVASFESFAGDWFPRLCRLVVLHFYTDWSDPCKQVNDALLDLAQELVHVRFAKVPEEMVHYVHVCWVMWGAVLACVCVIRSGSSNCFVPAVQVAAEVLAEISLKYKIIAVPTVLFVKVGG